MHFPEYWSRATASEPDRNGKPVTFSCWRSSDNSLEDAQASALAVARQMVQNVLAGRRLVRYPYGRTPLREEVLQKFTSPRGDLIAAITVNAYGALVLNTAGVMFVDVDFPPIGPGEQLRYVLARCFSRVVNSPEAKREGDVRDRLARFLERDQARGARLYRTYAGMRVLVTHELFDPAADVTQTVFEALDADPLYARLCRGQKSFRARLTPKPWRCGHTVNRIRWPHQSPQEQQAFEGWRATYAVKQSGYATCRFVEMIGNRRIHPDAQQIVDVHDDVTRANVPAALA